MKKKLLAIGIVLISFSVFYSLFLKDFIEKVREESCFKKAEKQYDLEIQGIGVRKKDLEKEKIELEDKMPTLLKELNDITKKLQKEFAEDENKKKTIEERTDSDFNRIPPKKLSVFPEGKFTNMFRSKDYIRENVARSLQQEYILNHQEHLEKSREIEDAEIRIQEIEIEVRIKKLDKDEIEKKYKEEKDYCFKRY